MWDNVHRDIARRLLNFSEPRRPTARPSVSSVWVTPEDRMALVAHRQDALLRRWRWRWRARLGELTFLAPEIFAARRLWAPVHTLAVRGERARLRAASVEHYCYHLRLYVERSSGSLPRGAGRAWSLDAGYVEVAGGRT